MPAQRRRPHTDEVARFSIANLRKQLGPAWRDLKAVTLTIDGEMVTIALVDEVYPSSYSGHRKMFRCGCGLAGFVVGVVPGRGVCCRRCGRWKGRDRAAALSG